MNQQGKVVAVCISERKGTPKRDVGSGQLVVDWGLESDAHAGHWHRQVSLLAMESIAKMQAKGLKVHPGSFAENITTEGLELYTLPIGTRLRLGGALVEVTQIGKICHDRCAVYYQAGDCVMPREGIFVKVLEPGTVKVGDAIEILEYGKKSVRDTLHDRLRKQLFLAAMIELTDGAYCAQRGQGAGMVQLGTLIVAPETAEFASWRARWPKTFLPDDAEAMRQRLRAEVRAVKKGLGDIPVCLSIGGFEIEPVVKAARAFQESGGDFVELNVHGGLQPWSEQGYFMGMALPQYRQRLVSWAEQLSALTLPLVVKFNTRLDVDFAQALRDLAHLPVWGYHFNVRDNEAKQPKYGFVEAIRAQVSGPLFCSGFAWTTEAARRLFALGIECVGVAEPVRNDPDFLNKLAKSLPQ